MGNTIMIYALSTCSHCKAAKKFLSENNVGYDFTDVDLLEGDEKTLALEEIKKHNPRLTFPTIIINGSRVIIGFQDREIREALNL